MMNLDSVLKSTDITLLTKLFFFFFSLVTLRCEGWAIKKAE